MAAAAGLLGAAALLWVWTRGYTLYYGDAEAHLNLARRIVDSRTPGLAGVGTVWLPLPHLLMAALVWHDGLWRSGLGGAIPVTACYVAATTLFFLAARRLFQSGPAALAAAAAFALNPNLLYLQATPMTEPVFFACIAGLVYCAVSYRESQKAGWVVAAGVANLLAALTRYEGWFLIPFGTVYFLWAARRRRLEVAAVFAAIASAGPLAWMANNWYQTGDTLDFYRGPYSARAIYQRGLEKGYQRYRGDHHLAWAWVYYRNAVQVTVGWPLIGIGLAGWIAARMKGRAAPLALLAPAPAFYLLSMYGGGTPIYMPHLWPFSYYNTRYGLAALPLLALGAGAVVGVLPAWLRKTGAVGVVALAVSPWLGAPIPEGWICWKESQVNSEGRRAWTAEAAQLLEREYRRGSGVFMPFGDLAGVLRMAGIPLREALHEDNPPGWWMAVLAPTALLREEWALIDSEGAMSKLAREAVERSGKYRLVKVIAPPKAQEIRIYKRDGEVPGAGARLARNAAVGGGEPEGDPMAANLEAGRGSTPQDAGRRHS